MAQIFIHGEIGEYSWWDDCVSAADIREQLAAIPEGEPIELHVHSGGGDVHEGLAIYNLLKPYADRITSYNDGLCASMATPIAMVGSTVVSPATSIWMFHNPLTIAYGNATEMRKIADVLDVHRDAMIPAYVEKTGKSEQEIINILDADTWLTGTEAVAMGFADQLTDALPLLDPEEDDGDEEPMVIPFPLSEGMDDSARKKCVALGWKLGDRPRPSRQKFAASADQSAEDLQARIQIAVDQAVAAANRPRRPRGFEPKPISKQENKQVTTEDPKISGQLTELTSKLSELQQQFSAKADEAKTLSDRLDAVSAAQSKQAIEAKYYQLRASALNHVAMTNRLTEDDFSANFAAEAADDVQRILAMSSDEARIELAVIERTVARFAAKDPIERVSAGDRDKFDRTLASRVSDPNPGHKPEDTAKADAFLANYQPKKRY